MNIQEDERSDNFRRLLIMEV